MVALGAGALRPLLIKKRPMGLCLAHGVVGVIHVGSSSGVSRRCSSSVVQAGSVVPAVLGLGDARAAAPAGRWTGCCTGSGSMQMGCIAVHSGQEGRRGGRSQAGADSGDGLFCRPFAACTVLGFTFYHKYTLNRNWCGNKLLIIAKIGVNKTFIL